MVVYSKFVKFFLSIVDENFLVKFLTSVELNSVYQFNFTHPPLLRWKFLYFNFLYFFVFLRNNIPQLKFILNQTSGFSVKSNLYPVFFTCQEKNVIFVKK